MSAHASACTQALVAQQFGFGGAGRPADGATVSADKLLVVGPSPSEMSGGQG